MYIEADGRLDVADVYKQVEWYREKGLVDASVDAGSFVDNSFIKPLTMPKK